MANYKGTITLASVTDGTSGAPAPYVSITGNEAFLYNSSGTCLNPSITLTASVKNVTISKWQYKNASNQWIDISGATSSTLVINSTDLYFNNDVATLKVITSDNSVYDEHTILKIKDGTNGTSIDNVVLSNDNQMVPCDINGTPISGWNTNCNTIITIYEGNVDSTSSWTITVDQNHGVTGSWDQSNPYKFNVDGISADTGYISFTCSKVNHTTITKTFSLVKVKAGADGTSPTIYSLDVSALAINKDINDTYTPSSINLAGWYQIGSGTKTAFTNGTFKIYKNNSSDPTPISGATGSYTITSNTEKLQIDLCDGSIVLDSQTVVVVSDGRTGAQGEPGVDSLSFTLGNYSDIIPCTNGGLVDGAQTITIPFNAYQGITRLACTASTSTLPSGMTIDNSSSESGTASSGGKIVINVANNATLGGATILSGIITITITAAGRDATQTYTWTKNIKSLDGTSVTITSTEIKYQKSTNGTSVPTGTWSTSIPSVNQGEFLWTRTIVNYSDNTSTTAYSVSRNAVNGTNGTSPTVISTVTEYQQSTNGTTVPTSWSATPPTAIAGQYMWTRITITYSDSATAVSYSVSKNGINGTDGKGITSTTVQYGQSQSGTDYSGITWGNSIPSVNEGWYLWTKTTTNYSSGNPSVVYTVSRNGIDGELYNVKANYDKVLKVITGDDITQPIVTTYDPVDGLEFAVYNKNNQTTPLNPGASTPAYYYDFSFLANSSDPLISFYNKIIDQILSNYTISSDNWVYKVESSKVRLRIDKLLEITSGAQEGTNNYKLALEKIQGACKDGRAYFTFNVYGNSAKNILIAHLDFSVENFVSNELGSLALFKTTATNIEMAVRNAGYEFGSTGLTITNGNLIINDKQIIDGNEVITQLFKYDKDNHKLTIEGDGHFTGDITGARGIFSGRIEAEEGYFKGDITGATGSFSGSLNAATGTFSGSLSAATGSFKGSIEAGSGKIGGFIIGGSALYADVPSGATTINSKLVLDSATPSIKLGNITLNGNTSTISGNLFNISPDAAEFRNVNISGKITAGVFEVGKTQAVGGSMIFRPSYKVESFTNNTLTVEATLTDMLSANSQYIMVVGDDGKDIITSQASSVSGGTVSFSGTPFSNKNPISMIILGNAGDIIIGINSTPTSSSLLLREGLTIRTFDPSSSTITKPNLYLGNLAANNGVIGDNVSGFGLFADNVSLNGSLTTKVASLTQNPYTYAGVNTIDGVSATVFGTEDQTKIVFWGGAGANTAEAIQIAPFQVTEKGSLYANSGKFEGAIITESEIQGVDIYGARIHGTGPTGNGLAFYNTTNGIVFYRGDYGAQGTEETFSIGSNGLKYQDSYFINVGGSGNIDFSGDEFRGTDFIATNKIEGNSLVANDVNGTNTITSTRITNNNNSYINFGNLIEINVKGSDSSQFQLEEARGIFETEYLITRQHLQVGNNGIVSMQFKQVQSTNDTGYDLYIA